MARHNDGKMNWKVSDISKQVLRSSLVWGGVGLLIVVVVIIFLETTGLGG